MKIVGLITEYNPFHNGHFHHIEEARRITGADFVIAVMSGNFVQRGGPALMDKYSRTRMALSCGADIVFELPVCYATASAEYFALGAVSLLHKLGIVDYLCFGSECGNIEELTDLAKILTEDTKEYNHILNTCLGKGYSFPAARAEAVRTVAPRINPSLLTSPNNILGIEYIKSLLRLDSSIRPVTIVRRQAGYHETSLSDSGKSAISSATAIRRAIRMECGTDSVSDHVPSSVSNILDENYRKTFPICEDDCSLLLKYKLLQETKDSLARYLDVTPDLARRIAHVNWQGLSFSEIAQAIKTKHWTLTRINRSLIHILLNQTWKEFELYNSLGYTQYARILGLKKSASFLLRSVLKKENFPIITKMADAKNLLTDTGFAMLKEDILASHLYNQIVFEKYGTLPEDEYTRGIILDE